MQNKTNSELINLIKAATNELEKRLVDLTPKNAERKAIIEYAKKDLNHRLCSGGIEFVINKDKGTVVALRRDLHGTVVKKGIAKCNPEDTFNTYIGKAIALRRLFYTANPLPVIYQNIVNPTEVEPGDIVIQSRGFKVKYRVDYIDNKGGGMNLTIIEDKQNSHNMTGKKAYGGKCEWATIIDDSKE